MARPSLPCSIPPTCCVLVAPESGTDCQVEGIVITALQAEVHVVQVLITVNISEYSWFPVTCGGEDAAYSGRCGKAPGMVAGI